MSTFNGFPKTCMPFLKKLARNNNREWFNKNKQNYEESVREPALAFIEAMQPELEKISPHFRAIPKKVGGSLMRVYRDTRFAKDKTPYKTNIGIQFRHALGKDVHAPGYYLHIAPDGCFFGVGIWRPESKILNKIREFIADNPNAWQQAIKNNAFKKYFELHGESLIRPPRGYPADHPLIEDLKRKDFIAFSYFDANDIQQKNFPKIAGKTFAKATPLMSYLCMAVDANF
ncbi:MAG: DUF2461 domain-containing protein [Gammaproteobacteria bacterium]